jgi:hypothetical protein
MFHKMAIRLSIAWALAALIGATTATGAESNSNIIPRHLFLNPCATGDIQSVDDAKSELDSVLKMTTAGSTYETGLDQVRRDYLPKYYVLMMQREALIRLREDRRYIHSVDEVLVDFHLAIMNRDPQMMELVAAQYLRLVPGGSSERQHFEVAGTHEPFLAPVPLLVVFISVYEDLYRAESVRTTRSRFRGLENLIAQWLAITDTAPYVEPSGNTNPSNGQLTTAWMYFHLGVLAKQLDPSVPSTPAEAYFLEAAKYIAPSCHPLFSESLKRLATNRKVCTDDTGGTTFNDNSGALDRRKYPYFCHLTDLGSVVDR